MAQVFLSYDREDGAKARVIAQALERAGHFVWWDMHIKGGAEYGREIEQALDKSDAVVVLWSERSIASAWVRDEAAAGRDKGCLVPVLIEPVSPPMGFRQYQNLDFSSWKGRGKPPGLNDLLQSIEVADPAPEAPTSQKAAGVKPHPARSPEISPLLKWSLIGGGIVAFLIALSVLLPGKGPRGVYTVAVAASEPRAAPLARDLLVNLSRLETANLRSVRLVGETGKTANADLYFEASSDDQNAKPAANLVLMNGKDRSILWSEDFEQPSGKAADLKQQLAFTAARILRCAVDGLDAPGGGLKPQILKLYLTGCAQIAEVANDPTPVIATMEQVIAASPKFKPAWQTLLLSQASITGSSFNEAENEPNRKKLARLVREARKVDPDMPEATLAESWLLPADKYERAIDLIEEAHRQAPDNPDVLSVVAFHLRRIGRMRESVSAAKVAAERDPLSPYSLNNYISALFYAGRFDAARQELARAQQIWPGTETVSEVTFRFNLRYGDPKAALKFVEDEGMETGLVQFLRARIDRDPTQLAILKAMMNKSVQARGAESLSYYVQTSGEFGWEDDLFKLLIGWPKGRDLAEISDIYFRPQMKKFRADPRFMLVAKHAGLLDYWEKSGEWPDFCAEPDLPYDCKAEAAKLS